MALRPASGRRINVLHISDKLTVGDSHMHGVTRLFSWWIPQFDESRFNVMAGSLRGPDRAGRHLEELGIRVHYLRRNRFDVRALASFMQLVDRERIDILHLHGYAVTNYGRVCSLLKRVPCIVHEHMVDERIPGYQRWADRVLARSTPYAMAVSDAVKAFLVRDRAIPADRVEVIYNGVPLNTFNRAIDEARREPVSAWRKQFDVPEEHLIVGIVGRLNPIKGQVYFLQAIPEILESFERVTFVIVGDGETMPELQAEARRLGVQDRVRFLGHSENVPSILVHLDVKVIASLSEGGPLTLFEAMAAGCAVVATAVGGLGEVIDDGVNGFLIQSRNPRQIAERTLDLLRDDDLRRTLGEQARQDVEQFDLCRVVRQFERRYEEIIDRWPR